MFTLLYFIILHIIVSGTTHSMQYTLPDNYTFGPGGEVLSDEAFHSLDGNLIVSLWNDDVNCINAALDPIESVFEKVQEENWVAAWHSLGALCIYLQILGDKYLSLDDKEGVKNINKTFGALSVQTLRGLDSNSELTVSTLPDLEIGLERITQWGTFAEKRLKLKSRYLTVVKGYGVKLFGDTTDEEREAMKKSRSKAYKRFLKTLSKVEKDSRRLPNGSYVKDEDDEDEEDEDEDKNPWKGAKSTDVDFDHAEFDAESAFNKYLSGLQKNKSGDEEEPESAPTDSDEGSGTESDPDTDSD